MRSDADIRINTGDTGVVVSAVETLASLIPGLVLTDEETQALVTHLPTIIAYFVQEHRETLGHGGL